MTSQTGANQDAGSSSQWQQPQPQQQQSSKISAPSNSTTSALPYTPTPTPLLPPPPPQQTPPTIAQRFSPTPARVPPSLHRQATQLPGLRLVLQLARTQPNNHFLPHRWGSLVQWPPHTQVHTPMEGTATPRAPMGHQPNHPQLDLFIGQVLGYHNRTPEPLCVCLSFSFSHDPPSRLSPTFLHLLCLFLSLRFVVCVPMSHPVPV